MEATFPSPPTTQRLGILISRLRFPSIRANSGWGFNPAMARFMARKVACRMFSRSISSTVPNATLNETAAS